MGCWIARGGKERKRESRRGANRRDPGGIRGICIGELEEESGRSGFVACKREEGTTKEAQHKRNWKPSLSSALLGYGNSKRIGANNRAQEDLLHG
jgi:hypothetical protein